MNLRIGIVLPQSTRYPLIGHQFTNGIRSCASLLGLPDVDIEIFIKDAGLGDDRAISEAVNMLVLQDQVDVITGLITNESYIENRRLFHELRIPVIAANHGAKVNMEDETSPFMFCNSLTMWQSCLHLGQYSARKHGKKVLMASSFYDGGYGMGYGFTEGFGAAGGDVTGYYITPRTPLDNRKEVLHDTLSTNKPDVIFVSMSGDDAIGFLEDYDTMPTALKRPMVSAPYLVDEGILEDHNGRATGIESAYTWSPELKSDGNRAFSKAFREHARRAPTDMAVLGYEVALFLAEAVKDAFDDLPDGKALARALKRASIDGPRGPLDFSAATNRTDPMVRLREVTCDEFGDCVNTVGKELGPVSEAEAMLDFESLTDFGGWKNPYLCI